jgi:hypothetical protein
VLIKFWNKIINLANVKMIELNDEGRGEIIFYFVDGSFLRCKPMAEEDSNFEKMWEYFSSLKSFQEKGEGTEPLFLNF